MKYLVFIIIGIYFSGCSYSSPYRFTKPNEIIQDKWVLIIMPDNTWEISKTYQKSKYANTRGLPDLYKSVAGTRYKIDIRTVPFNYMNIDILFDKDGDYEASIKRGNVLGEIEKEQGITYSKGWVTYIQGLKCTGGVFSRNFGGSVYSAMSKDYSIACGYYDTTEKANDGRRILLIDYSYIYADGNTHLQNDADEKRETLLTQQEAEAGLKKAVAEVVKTIKIKNMDIPRMQKEGLLHYDKEFKSTEW